MKTVFSLVAAFVGLTSVLADDGSNVTSTSSAHKSDTEIVIGTYLPIIDCGIKLEGLGHWFYNSRAEGPYRCSASHDPNKWSMFNAYRSGGTEGVHWKYTNDVNDNECLYMWKYYSADGQTLIATISGRTTTQNDPRRWCALPVYRPGGVQGKQWDYCECR